MADFSESIGYVLKNEGGYANDPSDRGGETNFGITRTTATGLGYTGDMKSMTQDEAESLWEAGFWQPGLDDVQSQALATAILDARANGPGAGNRILQQGLNAIGYSVAVDGGWGPETADATNQAVTDGKASDLIVAMMNATIDARNSFVASHPDQQKFLQGWLNRAQAMQGLADDAAGSFDGPGSLPAILDPSKPTGMAIYGGLALLAFLLLRRHA